MMNGTVYNIGFNLNYYDARSCDKLFDSVTYKGKSNGKNMFIKLTLIIVIAILLLTVIAR